MPTASPPTFYTLPGGGRLRGDAAASLLRMRKTGMPAGGIDVYSRTLEKQKQLYAAYKAGRGPLAAFPDPDAPHVRGCAIDLQTTRNKVYTPSAAHVWLTRGGDGSSKPRPGEKLQAHTYGWYRTAKPERWHFTYNPAKDTKAKADLAARLKSLGYRDLRAFQRAKGLTADGVAGPQTWTALLLAADAAPKPGPPAQPDPEVPTVPAEPKTAEFTLGVANCESYGGDKSEEAWKARASIFAEQGWSVAAVTETTPAGRTTMLAELKRLTGHEWKTWTLGGKTVAVLWDNTIWSNPKGADGKGKRRVTKIWSPFGHGGVCVPLVHRATGLGFDAIAHHTPPGSVATDAQKDAAISASAALAGGWPCVLAGDFNRDNPKLASWVRATSRIDTLDKAGTQTIDAAFIRGKLGAGKTTVINPGDLSDHKWLGIQLVLGSAAQ